jgi:DNA-binding IclR family transcriptional regulator
VVEPRRILPRGRQPTAFAEVAGQLGLPLGVTRVLLDDLVDRGLLRVEPRRPTLEETLLDRLIRGVERL